MIHKIIPNQLYTKLSTQFVFKGKLKIIILLELEIVEMTQMFSLFSYLSILLNYI